MQIFELKVGYPIYHIENRGTYGCKGDIITEIKERKSDEFLEIKYWNKETKTGGSHFAHPTEGVELLINESSKIKMFIVKMKAYLYRKFK